MNQPSALGEWPSRSLAAEISRRLEQGKRIRRTLPQGGRIHIDRPLPFLCVYRQPTDRPDSGTAQLVQGEASFLVTTAARQAGSGVARLLTAVIEPLAARFGSFLVVEIWSAPDRDVARAANSSDIEPTELRPAFVITAAGPNAPLRTMESLRRNLERIRVQKQLAEVTQNSDAAAHPPGWGYLLKSHDAARLHCDVIGICVRPIYRDHATGEVFPAVLRALKRGLGRALKQSFFTYAKTRTSARPEHYYSLGRRAIVKAVWEIDGRLAEISDSFSFLLQVTPVNAEAAWREFRRSRFQAAPHFYYRPLAVEPAQLKRRLYEVPLENIEDATLGDLFRQRQDELDRQITMLADVGTPRFLPGSLQVYGGVDDPLLEVARQLLERLPSRSREDSAGGLLSALQFAERARVEIEYYRRRMPEFAARVIVRDDMFSGLLCSGGNLLVGHQSRLPARRVEALLQHEVGTHLLTYYNGLAAPFHQLHSGFAGYDALQEGLAVLSEFLVGGLSIPRLRLLAARVVAVRRLIEGASFIETFRLLDRDYDFPQRVAYTITMRAYRGGGLTKDAVYLRGLGEVLAYLGRQGELEPLFVGKIAAEHIPLIQELRLRQVLPAPVLRPRYLEMPGVSQRLAELGRGLSVFDLIKGRPR